MPLLLLYDSFTEFEGGIISLEPNAGPLSDDPKTARFTPIVAKIQCDADHFPYVYATVGSLSWMIYDGTLGKWEPLFGDHSKIVALGGDQYQITVMPNGGWWRSNVELNFVSGTEALLP